MSPGVACQETYINFITPVDFQTGFFLNLKQLKKIGNAQMNTNEDIHCSGRITCMHIESSSRMYLAWTTAKELILTLLEAEK